MQSIKCCYETATSVEEAGGSMAGGAWMDIYQLQNHFIIGMQLNELLAGLSDLIVGMCNWFVVSISWFILIK